ncbi:MAG: peroxiredoxin [Rhodanobacter sp. 68-29]|nr:peroxiredoxin [Rhodanobacter sp.]ODU74863.1 MAG: peroxiredoxin [Rhodanobacter sp. SCN 69-32]OJY58525.1 MAG: peroxiredoxin [Rhodanobacter sp. 68-29]
MRRIPLLFVFTLLCGLLAAPVFAADAGAGADAMPKAGTAAPAFRLQDQNGHWRSPADYHGHWLVLYFYPKDFTPGCTTEVCTFRDDVAKLRQAGASVVGVSLDDVKSHADFAARYHVPFPLLADTGHEAAKGYGVLNSMAGMHYAKRTTFLIDPEGKIAKVYVDVDPKANSGQVLTDLAGLKKAAP